MIHCFIVLKHNVYLIPHKVILRYLEISSVFVLMKTRGLGGILVSTQCLDVCTYAKGINYLNISDNAENTCKISVCFPLISYEWLS